jgi:hypothetical protein
LQCLGMCGGIDAVRCFMLAQAHMEAGTNEPLSDVQFCITNDAKTHYSHTMLHLSTHGMQQSWRAGMRTFWHQFTQRGAVTAHCLSRSGKKKKNGRKISPA